MSFGNQAGRNAINAYQSNFMGYQAGYQATNAMTQISWVIKLVPNVGALTQISLVTSWF
jgi:hypothetical protein